MLGVRAHVMGEDGLAIFLSNFPCNAAPWPDGQDKEPGRIGLVPRLQVSPALAGNNFDQFSLQRCTPASFMLHDARSRLPV
eukprot:13657649-Heterocapsa_arctica.AAC.1